MDSYGIAFVYAVYSICAFGLFGSILSALVLARAEMRKYSSSYILLGLAFWDALFLITGGVQFIFMFGFPNAETNDSRISSLEHPLIKYLLYPLNKTAYTGSVYLTLLISVDRVIAVSMPLRVKELLSSKRTLRNVACVSGFAVIFNGSRWIELSVSMMDNYYMMYHIYAWFVFMYLIPVVSIPVLNIKIWCEVRRANSARRELGGQSGEADTSVTKMLISVVVLYVFCNLLVPSTMAGYFGLDIEELERPVEVLAREFVLLLPLLVNSAANFIIYFTMGTKFRSECIKFFSELLQSATTAFASSRAGSRASTSTTVGTETTRL